jgi:GMP synthase (glutamine-hydrolysing)
MKHMSREPDTTPATRAPSQQTAWRARKVLVVVHQRRSNPGYVGRWLKGHGYRLDLRRPRFGDSLPAHIADYAGVIIFGGPMSANDSFDYLRAEYDLIERSLEAEQPFLGICLGAQMLARHLGGRVFFHRRGQVEIGYHPIRPLPSGQRFPHWPSHVYQWHREGLEAPRDAVRLAEGTLFAEQAFQYGPAAFGLQFHPEMTLPMIDLWTTAAHRRLRLPGAKPRRRHLADHQLYGPRQRLWLNHFLAEWLRGAG